MSAIHGPTRRDWLRGLWAEPAPPAAAGASAVAWIDPASCLAWARSFCSTCAERCPVPGAIALDLGRPVVDAAACTGCGQCQDLCPAPGAAIVMATRL